MGEIGKEKIITLLQETIISLCQQSYRDSVEVDGIICITSLCSTDQHVVKIHQKLNSYTSNIPYTNDSNQEQITLDLHVEEGSSQVLVNDGVTFGKKKRAKGPSQKFKGIVGTAKKERKKQQQPANHLSGKISDETLVNSKSVDKYPYLMQTLCGQAEVSSSSQGKPYGESEDSSNSEHLMQSTVSSSSREVTPVLESEKFSNSSPYTASQTKIDHVHSTERSRRFDNFWKAVLKKRLQEKENTTIKQEPEEAVSTDSGIVTKNLMDTLIDNQMSPNQAIHEQENPAGSSTENSQDGCSNVENTNYQNSSASETERSNVNDNFEKGTGYEADTGKTYVTTVMPNGMFIKQEPVWDDEYSESSSQAQPKLNQDKQEHKNTNSKVLSSLLTSPSLSVTENNIKKEVMDSDEADVGFSKTDQQLEESNKNSILLKILKGKSLREAYRNTDQPGVSTVTSDHHMNSSPADAHESSDKNQNDQDNSLLYRLPFVSFQDLFSPNKNAAPFPPMDTNNSASRFKAASSTNNSAFDALTRSLLAKNSTERSKRRSKAKQITLADYDYEYESELCSEEEDIEMDDDPYDSPYTPYKDEEEVEYTLPKKKVQKRKPKMVTPKFSTVPKRKRAEYTCGLCGMKFDSIGERNKHEERELQERGLEQPEFVKCPLCGGFFADEESKNKHLIERHNIPASQFFT